jgi:hypothetical protein
MPFVSLPPSAPRARWGRPATIPGAFGITRQMFNDLDNLIRGFQDFPEAHNRATDTLVHLLAMTQKGFAQKMSRGVVTPNGQAGMPFTIPVRRLTMGYYHGWFVKRLGHAQWYLGNNSREAMPIEFGVNPRALADAVPRPILKNSAIETLRFVARTRINERFAADILGPLRNPRGQYRSFDQRIRPFLLNLAGRMPAGPQGRLP